MKKHLIRCLVAAACLGVTACYNDDDLWNAVDSLDTRVTSIEERLESLNSDIAVMKQSVAALQSGKVITDVTATDTGYLLTMSDGSSMTLTNGRNGMDSDKAPVVGIRFGDDGRYYWTLTVAGETEWLTDSEGNPLPVTGADGHDGLDGAQGQPGEKGDKGDKGDTGDRGPAGLDGSIGRNGVTPAMGVDSEGYWTVDVGKGAERITDASGNPVKALGEPGDSFFRTVTLTNENIVMTLADGTVISIPRQDNFGISVNNLITYIEAGQTAQFSLTFTRTAAVSLVPVSEADWTVSLKGNTLTVTAPDSPDKSECVVTLLATGKQGAVKALSTVFVTGPLKVLTFEDADYKGSADSYWSNLIPELQYGGSFYEQDKTYTWTDAGNTLLTHSFTTPYWNGGHAISDYTDTDLKNGDYMHQLAIYNTTGGHNGSKNFAVHFGYTDDSGYTMGGRTPGFSFSDGKSHVVREMWIHPTTYFANCVINGNSFCSPVKASDEIWISATGYDADGDVTATLKFYLFKGSMVRTWTRWDLSGLGHVSRIEFNMGGTTVNNFGFSQPAYFAYDDVSVCL